MSARFKSLSAILLGLTLLAMLPAVGVIVYTGFEAREHEARLARENTLRIVQNLAAVQERLTAATLQMLSTLALLPDVVESRQEACTALFQHLVRANPVYANVLLADRAGHVLASGFSPERDVSIADRKSFRDAVTSRGFSAGEYIVSRFADEPVFSFSLPAFDRAGQVSSVLVASPKLSQFAELFRHEILPEGAFMGIVDHKGRRLFRIPKGDDRFELGKPIAGQGWAAITANENDIGTMVRPMTDGLDQLIAFKKLRLRSGDAPYMYLVVGIPERAIGADALATTIRNVVLVLASGSLALLLAWAVGRRAIVAKVDRLVRAAVRFGAGDYDRPTGLDHDASEFGLLAAALDSMARARKNAGQALQQSEAKLQRLLAKAPLPLSLMNGRGDITFCNDRFVKTFGYDCPDVPTLDDWWRRAYPDEAYRNEVIARWNSAYNRATVEGIDIEPGEYRLTCKDGSQRVVEISGIQFAGGCLSAFVDVTGRKRAEEALRESENRLKAVVDNAPISIMLRDLEGRYLVVNPLLAERLGREAADLLGRNVREVVDPEWAEAIIARDREVVSNRAPICHELEIRELDGSMRSKLVNRFPVFDASGTITAIGGISTDITERKAFERGLLEAKLQADLANRAKSEFLANMSHELRTPLNSVCGFSEIMMMELFGPLGHPRYREYAKDVHEGAQLLLRIISDILDLSRIEAGVVTLDEDFVDVGGAVDSVSRLLVERAARKDIAISCRVDPELPRLFGDALRIKQIVLNLAGNAIKFTPPHGRVTLSARLTPAGEICLAVSDTGVGMAKDDIATALQPFGQLANSQSKGQPGTGLGLPITRSLAELHGGTLEIDSSPGRGTTVTVRFPARRTEGCCSFEAAQPFPA